MKTKLLYILLFALGAAAVMIGAFGAHGLENKIPTESLLNYKTAVYYHFTHVIVALISLILFDQYRVKWFQYASLLFVIGILFFSGSLYLLTTRTITGISPGILGPMTPIGGLFFILGWIFSIIAILKCKDLQKV